MGRGKKSRKHQIPKHHPAEKIEKRPDLIDGELPFDINIQEGSINPSKFKAPFLNYYRTRNLLIPAQNY